MTRRLHPPVLTIVALACAVGLSSCGTTSSPASTPTAAQTVASAMTPKPSMATANSMGTTVAAPMTKGAYLSYADYQSSMEARAGTTVVLFFHAPWCPDCRATDAALTTAGLPDGLTVVKVDYDSMTDLKQRYGITQQHTFVQVDAAGAALKKWTGSKDAAAIKAQTS